MYRKNLVELSLKSSKSSTKDQIQWSLVICSYGICGLFLECSPSEYREPPVSAFTATDVAIGLSKLYFAIRKLKAVTHKISQS